MASFGAAAFFILISCSYVSSQDYYEQTATSRGPDRNRLRDPVFILKSYLLGVLEVKCQHKLSIEAIEKPVLTAETCIKSEVNFEKLSQEYDKAAKNRTLSKFFVEQCSFIPTIRKCTKPVISAVSECFNRNDQLELKKFFDLVDNINTFACENDGDRIKQFFDNKGDECIFNSLIPDRFIVIYEITNRVASISDENYCIGLGPLRRSFREEMENCTSKVPYQLLDQSMDMVTGTLCSSSSTIFWFSFKNLILLLAIYLYSKMY